MELADKIKAALETIHPDAVVIRDRHGILGFVVSNAFRDLDTIDRQGLIYDALVNGPRALKKEELDGILDITGVTRAEAIAHGFIPPRVRRPKKSKPASD